MKLPILSEDVIKISEATLSLFTPCLGKVTLHLFRFQSNIRLKFNFI